MRGRDAATQLRTAARRWVAPVGADEAERATYAQDRLALNIVADHIRSGHPDWAMDSAANLDTAVREEIPPEVWKHLGGELIAELSPRRAAQGWALSLTR